MDESWDVFISYGHDDAEWVRALAENLERAGLHVFFDEWEIGPGDVLVHRLEAGLLGSLNGILVASPTSVTRPWVREEYAAMVTRAVAGRQRLIPVLLGDVELPPFAASRVWGDFRGVDGPEYERRVRQLIAALKGERPPRPAPDPAPDTRLVAPPGTMMRPEGAFRASLRISRDETLLAVDGKAPVRGRPSGPSHALEDLRWQADHARRLATEGATLALRAGDPAASGDGEVHPRLLALGRGLAEAFLPAAVQEALAAAVADAEQAGAALRLGVTVDEPGWADLPWETLTLRGSARPLVLEPRVELYRAVTGLGATPALAIPAPLRILVAIGSPDQDGDGEQAGELLDYEAELRRILDAVDPARRTGRASVRIVRRATLAELRKALSEQRFHVLHLSCHARPGRLVLEDDDGRPDPVSAERLAAEALPADRGVPLIVLAGCATALTERRAKAAEAGEAGEAGDEGEAALPGLARELLARGVPAVLAMADSVTDRYATLLGGSLYAELALHARPDPLGAFSHARRVVAERLRAARAGSRDARLAALGEWATPTLFIRGPSLPLYDPEQGVEELAPPPEPRFAPGVVVREVGDFVGRRRDERLLRRALTSRKAGVVLHGIGGVGKSSLAAQLLAALGEQARLVVSTFSQTSVDQILDKLGERLLSLGWAEGWDERHPLRRLAVAVRDPKVDWRDRLACLADLLGQRPVVLLLDNFEDNLAPYDRHPGTTTSVVGDEQLRELLAAWVEARGQSRLLVTSRFPFTLPRDAHLRLEAHHLGPLSLAETRKLVWRLPALDALEPEQLRRVWVDVGGHPRALEYLDALLGGGQARFDDVTRRLEAALAARGDIPDLARWRAGVAGNLDEALAETITLAANDVLLKGLLTRLDQQPLARRLLQGASVYRLPVDELGLAWQVGEEVDPPADPERAARLARLEAALAALRDAGQEPSVEAPGLSEQERAQLDADVAARPRPPLRVPDGLREALKAVAGLGLIAPTQPSEQVPVAGQAWLVHRWTAAELARLTAPADLTEAHRRAARYWRWRVEVWPQDRQADVEQLLEARYHHQAAGERDQAVAVTWAVCEQLTTWGAWSWAAQLLQETLALLPERSQQAAAFQHALGNLAHRRGDYDHALDWYRKSLTIFEELGDRAGMASSYHQLGIIAYLHGDYDHALDWYRQALTIAEELGDRAGMASTIGQIGVLLTETGRVREGLAWTIRGLSIRVAIGSPDVRIDVHWLRRQRELLGDEAFGAALRQELGDEGARGVLGLLDQAGGGASG